MADLKSPTLERPRSRSSLLQFDPVPNYQRILSALAFTFRCNQVNLSLHIFKRLIIITTEFQINEINIQNIKLFKLQPRHLRCLDGHSTEKDLTKLFCYIFSNYNENLAISFKVHKHYTILGFFSFITAYLCTSDQQLFKLNTRASLKCREMFLQLVAKVSCYLSH